jgi:hypothetical protein
MRRISLLYNKRGVEWCLGVGAFVMKMLLMLHVLTAIVGGLIVWIP